MRTVDEILTDFNLHEAAPRPLMEQRLHVLAAFVRDYERSYELLSQTLQRRTRMLREAEAQVVELATDNERHRLNEAQCMADLRETLTIHTARAR